MTKTKTSLAFSNGNKKSFKNGLCCSTTLPNLRNKNFDESHYESFVEKYNEKINLWQSSYLFMKKNYLYLYDKKPKTSDKPNEYLYLNNKISITFHRRLFKLKAIKNYVVNIKINNEALSKSLIEDNKHNIYLSFKTQNNYNNFRKVFDIVLTTNQFANSVSINQKPIKEQIKKYKSYRHLKNKSESHIQLKNNLINKNREEMQITANNDNNKSYKSKLSMNGNTNTNNKSNNSFTNSAVHNVFTFSKIDGTNDKNVININSNSSKRSNSCNTNKRKIFNNLVIEEENNIMSLKSNNANDVCINNNINKSKKCINYFNVNFNENNLKLKYNDEDSNLNINNIFDADFPSLLPLNTTNEINQRPYTSLVYSIRRKKEKEKEDVTRISKRIKKHRTNSCYRFQFNNEKYNNIFLNKNSINEVKTENKIKTIKIKLKDYHSFNTARPSINTNNAINISDYSRDEKNINMSLMMNNTGNQELINYSFNEIEEKNSECKSSKSKEKEKEKENDKTKNNTIDNTEISLGSLKSYKANESKEKSKENSKEKDLKQNDNFENMDIYSYIDASNVTKNKSNIEDNNPISLLENNTNNNIYKNDNSNNNDENISNIRSQISQVIKQKEEMISKNEFNNDNNDEDDDTNIIFTSRLREEMTEHNSPSKENINETTDNNNNTNNNISNNEGCSNIIDTSNVHCRNNHLRFSSDLNDIIQTLEKGNKTDININTNTNTNIEYNNANNISIPLNSLYKDNKINFDFIDINFDGIINDKNMMKNLIKKLDNNEIFIYDSFICDLLLTKIKETLNCLNYSLVENTGKISKNKILGKIYELSDNKYIKNFLMNEMISIISKQDLSKLVINAIEVYNKKCEVNTEEKNVAYEEYIINVFNKYLSRNELNNEQKNLFENILPKKIKENFGIKEDEGCIANIIKNDINVNTLFNSMQYHNKIYAYNINIENEIYPDFNSIKPFTDNNNFKFYISPYISEKWKFKAFNKKSNNNVFINNTNSDKLDSKAIRESNTENRIYKQYKINEKFEEMQKFNLFNNIISNINQNEINLSLNNCEYFLEKYKTSSSFLHSMIYLCLSFIYNKKSNFEFSEKYFSKSLSYLNWLYPNESNFLFFEIEYRHLLILLNNEENIISQNLENIVNLFDECENMWKKYYTWAENWEMKLDAAVFKIYYRINPQEKNDENFLNLLYYDNIRPLLNEFDEKIKERKNAKKLYIKLFVEFFKKCPGCNINILNDLIRCFDN